MSDTKHPGRNRISIEYEDRLDTDSTSPVVGNDGLRVAPESERPDVLLSKMTRPVKRIGVSSQNFRTITGHAGKARRFLLYESSDTNQAKEVGRLDLPKSMALHEYRDRHHPLFSLDVVITGSCGNGFIRRLDAQGVAVIATSETDPLHAAESVLKGRPLAPPLPHDH